MPIRIGSNVASINAGRHLDRNQQDFAKRIERLSSGLRINRGADDAAGLSVSEGMRAELKGMKQAVSNAEQGVSMIQLAEGSLNEVSAMLGRMRELAVQSANSTLNDGNRESLAAEFMQLTAEIDRIGNSTSYNGNNLLTGFGNLVDQDIEVSTALNGFTGATEIDISGAMPGTYTFTDTSNTDNQITLSIDLPDGTQLSQAIDVGPTLDREVSGGGTGRNLVATGTTFVANFDRLGVQVTLVGPEVDKTNTTLRSEVTEPDFSDLDPAATESNIIIGDRVAIIDPAVDTTLEQVADKIRDAVDGLNPPVSVVFNEGTGDAFYPSEIQIDPNGHALTDVGNILSLAGGNSYSDGRLDGKKILISDAGGGGLFQVGAFGDPNNRIALNIGDMRATGNELNLNGISVANQESSRQSIARIDTAILVVSRQRGTLGAVQNRLQFTSANLGNSIQNLQAAEAAIRDADVAEEISQFSRAQILTQAATAMVTQANALPQSALQLLQ